MATMRDIRRRIKTVRNIQQITKALEMVAAARLQKAQRQAAAAGPFADAISAVVSNLALGEEQVRHPLLEVRPVRNEALVVITSERGMAGSYNYNVIRRAQSIMASAEERRGRLITVGKKGRQFFGKRGMDIAADFPMPSSEVHLADAWAVTQAVTGLFMAGEADAVRMVYTESRGAAGQRVVDVPLLPVAPPKRDSRGALLQYVFEPGPDELLADLLPRYVEVEVFRAMLDALASEHAARMTAMNAATTNAAEMISRLTLDLNRARQAAITKELAEIVSGAEALK